MERKKIGDEPTEVKAKKPKTSAPKEKEKERKEPANIYGNLGDDDDDFDDRDEDEGLDDDGDEDYKDPSFMEKYKFFVIGGVVAVIIGGIVAYNVFKPEPPPPEPVVVEEVDPTLQALDDLYKLGIGKEAISEERIYEQGTLDSQDFRKDFTNQSATETYAEPVEIMTVNDSVSYVKHRTMTDDGIDVYWVDAVYKEKDTTFTVPYYVWRTLAEQGVMDVVVEVVTDANDKVFIASITARPPAEE